MNRAQPLDAPVGLLPLPRPLMTGEMLDAAFRLFRAGILRCLPYSGLAVLVLELPTLYSTFVGPVRGSALRIPYLSVTGYLLVVILITPLFGVITLRLNSLAQGIRPRIRRELAAAVMRWPAALLATVFAFGYPAVLLLIWPLLVVALPTEALIFAAVPVLWPVPLLVVALPAFWCDGLNPFSAIAQAVRLSARRSWRMVGAILATACMVMVFYVLSAVIVGMMSPLFGRADLFLIATVGSMLSLVVGAFGVPFVVAVLIVAYQDLKLREQARRMVRS
ncbi:MAG TPA: hypothetical protein VEX61_13535 [Burkholderiales bacterium]|nr:hypothetical protein [Burkholderiales bacterium]